MKTFKFLLISMSLLFLGAAQAGAANITWLDYDFNYNVRANSVEILNQANNVNGYTRAGVVGGDTVSYSRTYGSDGDPLNSNAASSVSSGGDLDLTLKTGATGGLTANGVKTSAYLQSSSETNNNGTPSGYGIQIDPYGDSQDVIAWTAQRFEVDNSGYFNLTGLLNGGIIDANDVEIENPNSISYVPMAITRALYEFDGSISLIQNLIDDDGIISSVSTVASISLDDLLTEGLVEIENILLLSGLGDKDVTYDLKAQINLSSQYSNCAAFLGTNNPWIELPEGSFGSLGTESDPLAIEGYLTAVTTPIPGSAMLLLSGVAALIGYRTRKYNR